MNLLAFKNINYLKYSITLQEKYFYAQKRKK